MSDITNEQLNRFLKLENSNDIPVRYIRLMADELIKSRAIIEQDNVEPVIEAICNVFRDEICNAKSVKMDDYAYRLDCLLPSVVTFAREAAKHLHSPKDSTEPASTSELRKYIAVAYNALDDIRKEASVRGFYLDIERMAIAAQDALPKSFNEPASKDSVKRDAEIIKHVRDALEMAHECNESNGYNNAFDIDLIVEAIEKSIKETS